MTAIAETKQPTWLTPARADRLEQVVIALLWVWLVQRVLNSFNPDAWLLLISETAIMIFTVFRRPTQAITMRLGDWLLAVTATAAPMLVVPGVMLVPSLEKVGIALFIIGNLFQLWAKLILRRSFGVAAANRGIKIAGPYRFVRHPMYAGYAIIHLAFLLLMFMPVNLVLYAIGWWAQILRIKAEENVLSQDPKYADYMTKVRWRLIPGIF